MESKANLPQKVATVVATAATLAGGYNDLSQGKVPDLAYDYHQVRVEQKAEENQRKAEALSSQNNKDEKKE